ncbi:PorV/PorQ family protein [Porphyromonadaceae bacterium W3.11]|nr:PorV/PorQ family protein [Porphyromonadaceae bacterium W3.11]
MRIKFFEKYLLLILSIGLASLEMNAQNRLLPILEAPVDARAASMGSATLMSAKSNYLYINPASILYQPNKYTISANGMLYPTYEEASGRLKNGSISLGAKFLNRHVVFAGFRYQGGLSYQIIDGPYDDQDIRKYNPFDWAADLGYAFRINDQFSAFATMSFIQSYTGRPAYAGSFSVGANYLTDFSIARSLATLNVAARVSNFGTHLYYSSSERYNLPAKAEITSDLTVKLGDIHKITSLVGARYFFLPIKNQVFQANLGGEYTVFDLVSFRTGVQIGTRYTSHWTAGVGAKFMGGSIDFAYLKGLNTNYSDRLVLSLSYNY